MSASFRPRTNSISRNCTDWKPDAGFRWYRKPRKSVGRMVSRTRTWLISGRRISTTRSRSRVPSAMRSASTCTMAESISCSICLNHSSYDWWTRMNSVSSCCGGSATVRCSESSSGILRYVP
jgi:hypothetical protein